MAFWALALVPLVLLKENRQWRACAILLPLAAILAGFQMLVTLLGMPASTAEPMRAFLGAMATGWACVWLLGSWLSRRRRSAAILSVVAVLLMIVLLAYLAHYGISDEAGIPWAMVAAVVTVALVLPFLLTRWCCPAGSSPRRFLAWLFLWTMLVAIASVAATVTILVLGEELLQGQLSVGLVLTALLSSLLAGGIGGVLVYLANFAFLMMAFRNGLYRERFEQVLGLRLSAASPSLDT